MAGEMNNHKHLARKTLRSHRRLRFRV